MNFGCKIRQLQSTSLGLPLGVPSKSLRWGGRAIS